MQVQFRQSEIQKKHTVMSDTGNYYILVTQPSNWSKDCFVAVRKSAVDIVKDEPTYCVGQRFKIGLCNNEYILAHVGENKVTFIAIEGGNLYTNPIRVNNLNKITAVALNMLTQNWALVNL